MLGPKRVTLDMLEAAKAKGWDVLLTARHYGMHRRSIEDACIRLGVDLPLSNGASAAPKPKKPTPKKPSNAVWSASPEAIERALRKLKGAKNGTGK